MPFSLSRPRCSRDRAYLAIIAFLAGGLLGWGYEVFICGPLNGEPLNLLHGGILVPFLYIYGIGGVLIEVLLGTRAEGMGMLARFAGSALLCTAFEYGAGLFMLHVLGVQTWDYRMPGWRPCTPDGLVSLRAMLTFGFFGMVQLSALRPWSVKLLECPQGKALRAVLLAALAIVLVAMANGLVFHWVDTGGAFQ